MKKRPAVFLDRDGTLMVNIDYIHQPEKVKLFAKTIDSLKKLRKAGFYLIVVTNQSGAARGYFKISDIHAVNRHLQSRLKAQGAYLDAFFYCPHHVKGVVKSLAKECDCRKPRTGMVKQALKKFPIDLAKSYVVGDNLGDVELAKNAKMAAGILVRTGHGRKAQHELKRLKMKNKHVVTGIAQAAKWILTHKESK
jgi:D-glycero-D-manno-heptose 1,7-bisphosphate phosphatase